MTSQKDVSLGAQNNPATSSNKILKERYGIRQ